MGAIIVSAANRAGDGAPTCTDDLRDSGGRGRSHEILGVEAPAD